MDFVLMLHSHLPWVLNHGRWPHGSDWLSEAALDTYLPAARDAARARPRAGPGAGHDRLHAGARQPAGAAPCSSRSWRRSRPAARGLRPGRARHRRDRAASPAARALLARAVRAAPRPLPGHRLRPRGGVPRPRDAADGSRSSAPPPPTDFCRLLARDESIRLQLAVGVAEHRRLFGRYPAGCWLPECAYRPRGPWAPWPTAPKAGVRRGIEEHLADAGFKFFFVDAHLAAAGRPLGVYGDPLVGPRDATEGDGAGRAACAPVALPRVSHLADTGHARRRRVRARPPRLHAGLESASRVSRVGASISSSTRFAGPAGSSSGG